MWIIKCINNLIYTHLITGYRSYRYPYPGKGDFVFDGFLINNKKGGNCKYSNINSPSLVGYVLSHKGKLLKCGVQKAVRAGREGAQVNCPRSLRGKYLMVKRSNGKNFNLCELVAVGRPYCKPPSVSLRLLRHPFIITRIRGLRFENLVISTSMLIALFCIFDNFQISTLQW